MGLRKFTTAVRRKKREDTSQTKEGVFVVERRRHPRRSIELPLDYSHVESHENRGGIAANVSEGGLLVYLPEAIGIGSLLKIEILFVKGLELSSIKANTKVVWYGLAPNENWGEYKYGLEFQSFQEGDLQNLKRLLKEVADTHDR
jgi:c-di-GMP-binding flagellar brake protein YcgR